MCFAKRDLMMWINIEGFDQRLLLRMRATPDRHSYNDFFTIERPLGGGREPDTLFVVPFRHLSAMSYAKTGRGDGYTICLDMREGDPRLKQIFVATHCFDYFGFRKMLKEYQNHRNPSDTTGEKYTKD